jgi:putative transposase
LSDTSHPKKRRLSLESTKELSDVGKKPEKSKRLEHRQDKEGITLIGLPQEPLEPTTELLLSTPESVVGHSNPTLTGKSLTLVVSTQKPKSVAKLEEDLISNGRSFFPYWNESSKEMSEWLSLPTKTDWQDSALTCSNGFVSKTGVNSWYSTKQTLVQSKKWLKTSLQSCTALVVDCTDSENINLKSKKIRIYPSQELNKVWRKWLAACRYCYNIGIAIQRKKRLSKLELRNEVMRGDLPEWVKETPCHIRQNAIFDAHRAFKASSRAKFRSIRDYSQAIKFNDANFSKGTWYSSLTKGLTFKASEVIPECNRGTQLLYCKGRWFAVFPVPVILHPLESTRIIALDPGVRTFMTGFDGNKFIEFGGGDMGRIARICQQLDDLMSRLSQATKQRRKRMRQAAHRMRIRIRNLVDECQKQTACYLTSNYRVIFLPTFESSQMVARARRKIRSKTARAMLTWAHYRFKQTIKHQANIRNASVIDVTEEYTSKTCTHCGHVHHSLGGSKVFTCPECGYSIPRDYNGAFGILLKALRDTASISYEGDSAIVTLSGNRRVSVA